MFFFKGFCFQIAKTHYIRKITLAGHIANFDKAIFDVATVNVDVMKKLLKKDLKTRKTVSCIDLIIFFHSITNNFIFILDF